MSPELPDQFSELDRDIYDKFVKLFIEFLSTGDRFGTTSFNDGSANIFLVHDECFVFMEDAMYLAFWSSFVHDGRCGVMEIDSDIAFFCFFVKSERQLRGFHQFWLDLIDRWNKDVDQWAPSHKFDLEFVDKPNSNVPRVRIKMSRL